MGVKSKLGLLISKDVFHAGLSYWALKVQNYHELKPNTLGPFKRYEKITNVMNVNFNKFLQDGQNKSIHVS